MLEFGKIREIIMVQKSECKNCGQSFSANDNDLDFYKKISPTFAGKTFEIPAPTICYECRLQRRLAWRNERNLFLRPSSKSGKPIVAVYPEDSPYKVFSQDEWWADDWDATEFGRDFDNQKSFFEQLFEIQKQVPRISLINMNNENSDYINQAAKNKNCYMSFDIGWCENVLHSRTCYSSKDLIDCFNCRDNCEFLYECMNCQNANNSSFCTSCENISGCHYGFDLRGCRDCILSSNLQNKQYYFENKELSKEEFEKKKAELDLGSFKSRQDLKAKFEELKKSSIHKFAENIKCEDCSGNNLTNCKSVRSSFGANKCEDGRYFFYSERMKDSCDDNFSGGESDCELNLETIGCYMIYNNKFLFSCWTARNLLYCNFCHSCKDCFGCVGLRNKQYCILNKQYTAEEYEKKVVEIIEKMKTDGEWGEYFPIKHSPFPYNFTLANDYFPLSKEEITAKGYQWHEKNDTLAPSVDFEIPDNIKDVDKSILDKVLSCVTSKRPFKIQPQELAFYIKQEVPIPRKHPDQRYLDRFVALNPLHLYHRQCMCEEAGHEHTGKCPNEFETTYAPERPEKVYCESCYQKKII